MVQDEGPRTLYVGSLHAHIKERDLKLVFEPFGELDFINLHMDERTGQSNVHTHTLRSLFPPSLIPSTPLSPPPSPPLHHNKVTDRSNDREGDGARRADGICDEPPAESD